jgi:cell division protein FtsL
LFGLTDPHIALPMASASQFGRRITENHNKETHMPGGNRVAQSASVEEFFDHCVDLNGRSAVYLEKSAAIQEALQQTTVSLDTTVSSVVSIVQQCADDTKALYAPDNVRDARNATQEFKEESVELVASMKAQFDAFLNGVFIRTIITVVLLALTISAVAWCAMQFITSPQEIQRRHDELTQLKEQKQALEQEIADKKASFEKISGRLIYYNGGQWIRVFESPTRLCLDSSKPQTCDYYAPVK